MVTLLLIVFVHIVSAQEIDPTMILSYFREHKVNSYTMVAEVTFDVGNATYDVNDVISKMFNYNIVTPYLQTSVINVSKGNSTLTIVFKVSYRRAFPVQYIHYSPTFNSSMNIPQSMRLQSEFIANTSPTMYDLAYRTMYFVSNYMKYDPFVPNNRDISTVWNSREGVCNDYTRVMAYMLKYSGISDIVYVNGLAFIGTKDKNGRYLFEPHQILMVKIGAYWIPFDPTNFARVGQYDPLPILFIPMQVYKFDEWSPYLSAISDDYYVDITYMDIEVQNETLDVMLDPDTNLVLIRSNKPTVVYVGGNISNEYMKFDVGGNKRYAVPYFILPNYYGVITRRDYVFYPITKDFRFSFLYDDGTKVLIISNLLGNKYYIVDGVNYVIGNYTKGYGVVFKDSRFELNNNNNVLFGTISIPVKIVSSNKIDKLFTFKTDINEYNYVIRTNDTESVIALIRKNYISSQIMEVGNNIIIVRISSDKLIIPQLNFVYEYSEKNPNVNVSKVEYGVSNTLIYFNTGNITFNIQNIFRLIGPIIATVKEKDDVYGIQVMWSIVGNNIVVSVPNKFLNKNVILHFNGDTDLTEQLNVFKSIDIVNIKVVKILNGSVRYNAMLRIQFKDELPISVVSQIANNLNVTSMNGTTIYAYVESETDLQSFVPGALISIKYNGFKLSYRIPEGHSIYPEIVYVNLVSNDLERNLSTIEITMIYDNNRLTDVVLYYNVMNYIKVNDVNIPIKNKELYETGIRVYVDVPFDMISSGLEVEGTSNIIYNITYSKVENLFNLMVHINGVLLRDKLSCNVPYVLKVTKDGFDIKPLINKVEPIVCNYLGNKIVLNPKVPYIASITLVDLDSINDIASNDAIYADYSNVYLYVVIKPFSPIKIVIDDDYKYEVRNPNEIIKLPHLGLGRHNIKIYDMTTGVLIMEKDIRVIEQSLLLKILHNSIFVTFGIMIVIIILVFRYVNSVEVVKTIVTDYVRRYFPNAKYVEFKKVGNKKVFVFIDEELQGIIYVTVNKKNKIEDVNVEVL